MRIAKVMICIPATNWPSINPVNYRLDRILGEAHDHGQPHDESTERKDTIHHCQMALTTTI